MAHVNLARLVAAHPHGARLRARTRKMRPIKPSRKNELAYRAALGVIVKELRAAGRVIVEALRPGWPAPPVSYALIYGGERIGPAPSPRGVGDAATGEPPVLPAALRRAAGSFGNIKGRANAIASVMAKRNLASTDANLISAMRASVGVNVPQIALGMQGQIAAELGEKIADNVALITSIPEQYLDRVQEMVLDAWKTGLRFEDIVEGISEIGDITERRAGLIARDQTSKMNAAFNQVRQTDLGITSYEWQTANDERVRDSHDELDGEEFDWDSPPDVDGEKVNPGEAINCRCNAIPIINLDEDENGDVDEQEAA